MNYQNPYQQQMEGWAVYINGQKVDVNWQYEQVKQQLHQNINQPQTIKVSPEIRKQQIEHELDIIKGKIPTPKGYTINSEKVKELMKELKDLNASV